MAYAPPFSCTDDVVMLVASIAQKVGRAEASEHLDRSPHLRRENRIRTIHSSLAIENNALSLEQVTAVVEGKLVVAPPRDLLEVQNAIAVYEALDAFDPTSVDDLLRAHGLLMKGLVSQAGCFRSGNVGIFDGDMVVHLGTPSAYVPQVMADLFAWLREGSVHPLVASCVFHYEFEFIHPFQDGNGRMGRLWQTLILSRWNQLFAWLPVESMVKACQEEYYAVLGASDASGDCTEFIVFMLGMISSALDEVLSRQDDVGKKDGINVGLMSAASSTRERLLRLIEGNPTVTMAQMAESLGIGKRQVERLVADLKSQERLVRVGSRRNGRWEVRRASSAE